MQIVPPNEVVVLISFELTLGEMRGMLNLCIPFNSIERIGGKLSANSWISPSRKSSSAETIERITKNLRGAPVEVVVHLADTTISTRDLIGLRVGDIITTEKDVKMPLIVNVEGVTKFRGKAGAMKGHKAIRIEEAEPVKK